MKRLLSGTVTFLFSDVQGSTRLLQELGDRYVGALEEHRRVLREACAAHCGVEVDTQGDAFFCAFPKASDAVAAAAQVQEALKSGPIHVRIGLHTGEPTLTDEGYAGIDVHTGARIAACAHGDQVVLSEATRRLVDSDVRDLGLHKLKDLSAPQRLYQLGEFDFPPLRSLNQTNLPIQPTPFIGRERELADVLRLLRRPDVHLLTLTGAGGTGKTRLALQSAAELAEEYEHGIWWIPLAALQDEQLVDETVAQRLGATDRLASFLSDKRLLLLLDNFEQVISAGPRLGELLVSSPNIKLLVTSREPLHVAAEHEYVVPTMEEAEAGALFLDRVSERGSSEDVLEICRRVDCLPLAVELVASRAKALSLRQILDRLEQRLPLLTGGPLDAPQRQRTLRATIEWSHNLLAEDERRLFRRLTVFSGGCTLEAAERVVDADVDLLVALVDKSLIARKQDRFLMLETIREYALERLNESGESEKFRRRHAEHYLSLADEAAPELEGGRQAFWLERLDADHENFRAATDWTHHANLPEIELRLVGSLWWYWLVRGYWHEGRQAVERALDGSPRGNLGARFRALQAVAFFAQRQGDVPAWRRTAEKWLQLGREQSDTRTIGRALLSLATLASTEGDHERANELFAESRRLSSSTQDTWNLSIIANNLGDQARVDGDFARAIQYFHEAVELARSHGDTRGVALMLINLGQAEISAGHVAAAAAHIKEGLRASQELSYSEMMAAGLEALAAVCAASENPFDAAVLLAAGIQGAEFAVQAPLEPAERVLRDYTLSAIGQELDDSARTTALDAGRRMSLDEAVDYALQVVL